jgi:hypothetical protein
MAQHGFDVLRRLLVRTGITLLVPSIIYLALGMLGLLPTEPLAVGESSGLKTIASVAVAGCLLAAVGYSDE